MKPIKFIFYLFVLIFVSALDLERNYNKMKKILSTILILFSVVVNVWQFDIHYEIDSMGSRSETAK